MRGTTAVGAGGRRRRGRPLGWYLLGVVALALGAAGARLRYGRVTAHADALEPAPADAAFAARLSAEDLAAQLATATGTVAATAAQPALAALFDGPTAGCTLQFGNVGAFSSGRLDVV